jgi:hypothetical protein
MRMRDEPVRASTMLCVSGAMPPSGWRTNTNPPCAPATRAPPVTRGKS